MCRHQLQLEDDLFESNDLLVLIVNHTGEDKSMNTSDILERYTRNMLQVESNFLQVV